MPSDSVPATTRYTVPAARAARSAVRCEVSRHAFDLCLREIFCFFLCGYIVNWEK